MKAATGGFFSGVRLLLEAECPICSWTTSENCQVKFELIQFMYSLRLIVHLKYSACCCFILFSGSDFSTHLYCDILAHYFSALCAVPTEES